MQLAVPVQLISSATRDPLNPIENPVQFLQTGDVQISTGGGDFVNIETLPTASDENNTDLIVQLSDAEKAEDYEIRFHDPDGVWVDFSISVTCPKPVVEPIQSTTETPCDLEPIDLCAFNNETQTHTFLPLGEDGKPLDLQGEALSFVVERNENRDDLITGHSTQDLETMEVSFDTALAEGDYKWSVRTNTRRIVIGYGTINVEYVPEIGPDAEFETNSNLHCLEVTSLNGSPIEGATVRVTTDEAGLNTVGTFPTNANGEANIAVAAAGTYFAHISKEGFSTFRALPIVIDWSMPAGVTAEDIPITPNPELGLVATNMKDAVEEIITEQGQTDGENLKAVSDGLNF